LPMGARENTIARLKDETTCRHAFILRHGRGGRERNSLQFLWVNLTLFDIPRS
jgi:hypothetical protein